MSRKYKNPPIIEAICQFDFDPGSPWDLTFTGLLYDELRETFPDKGQQKVVSQDFSATPEGPRQSITVVDRMQFITQSRTSLVQVSPHFLSANHLRPYDSWNHFLPLIREALDAYRKVAAPTKALRVGLRYINRVELPVDKAELADYFEFRPHLGSSLPQDYADCIVGITVPVTEADGLLKLQLTTAAKSTGIIPMVLDLDHWLSPSGGIVLDSIIDWVDKAHGRIEEIFEAAITDKTRKLFEEV